MKSPIDTRSSGASLAKLLLALIIVLVILGLTIPRFVRRGPAGEAQRYKATVSAARDAVCQANLSAVREAIAVYATTHGSRPKDLSELSLGADATHCAVGGEAYEYSPEDGRVRCPHVGHGAF